MKKMFKKFLAISIIGLMLISYSPVFAQSNSGGSSSQNFWRMKDNAVYFINDGVRTLGDATNKIKEIWSDVIHVGSIVVDTIVDGFLHVQTTSTSAFLVGNDIDTDMFQVDTTNSYIYNNVPALFVDGSASAPSISFASDTDTGLYLGGVGNINVSLGGSVLGRFTTTGFTYGSNNNYPSLLNTTANATTPNIVPYAGDGDTGIGYDPTGAISLIDDGTQAMKVASTSIQVVDGTASIPAYSFLSDPDTGFYRLTTGATLYSADGSFTWGLTSAYLGSPNTGRARILNEVPTATNPVYSFEGDYNTGIGWTSADILTLIAGGTACIEIDANTGEVKFLCPLATGPIEFEEDAGAITAINLPVSSTPSDGDEMSMSISSDSNIIAKFYSEADGVGGSSDFKLVIPNGDLEIGNTGTSTFIIDSDSATQGACLKLSDFDSADYTYCVVQDGSMTCSTDSCE